MTSAELEEPAPAEQEDPVLAPQEDPDVEMTSAELQEPAPAEQEEPVLAPQLEEQEVTEDQVAVLGEKHSVNKNVKHFKILSDNDLHQLRQQEKNVRTAHKTEAHVQLFQDYLALKLEERNIKDIPPDELSKYLGDFIVSIQKSKEDKDGSREYEPVYIRNIFGSIDRYLREVDYQVSIMTDNKFGYSREMLATKMQQLKRIGKGNKPYAAHSPSEDEYEKMWNNNGFGYESPQQLNRTIWWFISTELGMRATNEH